MKVVVSISISLLSCLSLSAQSATMRKLFILISTLISSIVAYSQSYDEKIANAMKVGDWFALDSIYRNAPKGEISDFLEVYSRGLIGNRFNRTAISIPAFEELLGSHFDNLTKDQLIGSAILYAIDLNREGDNAKAASILTKVYDGLLKDGDIKSAKRLETFIQQYASLAGFDTYKIKMDGDTGRMPFKIVPVGKHADDGVHIHLEESFLNGIPAEITFDTGAAANIISASLVEKFDLIPIDVMTKVSGIGSHNGYLAIAKELKIGNITISNVPFFVMDITANNEEADRYLQSISIIVGSDLMLQLHDLTIDFDNNTIIVPAEAPIKTQAMPNLCFSSGMNLCAKGTIRDCELLMNIDTGDSGYGYLGKDFYSKNKKFIKSTGESAVFRKAGIGGTEISKGYKVSDMSIELGGNTVSLPNMNVMKKTDSFGYDCNIGLKTLMLFSKVRFNLIDFVLTTE
ncbi:MAG: retropepsin-like domain-containing protein [Muribaculaceae bacterium]|nr:retropepsin-like domain-containing protein [Muribaculaceae bacterium]